MGERPFWFVGENPGEELFWKKAPPPGQCHFDINHQV